MQINIEELNKSFERLGNCNDILEREKELLQEVERLKLEEKKYRELYSLYLANPEQLKQSFKELDKHNDLLELESKLLEEAKRLGLEEKKYRELYNLYLANSEQLKQSFEKLVNHNDLLELENEILQEAKRLGLEEKKYRELYSLYLANSAQLKQSFKELDKHNDLLELESKLLEEAKRLGLEGKKYRELYSLYLISSEQQLEKSFKSITSGILSNRLQHERDLAREAQRFGITVDEYRQLYRFSYKPFPRLFVRGSSLREKQAWDYIQLVCIPICLGLITWSFNGLTKDREIDIQGDRQKQEILNKYFDAMTTLESQSNNDPKPNQQEIQQARTLSVLRELNDERNAQVLRFLKTAKLLPDEPGEDKQKIDLSQGNLGKAKLNKADLRRVRWKSTIFHSAELRKARLDQAELQNSDFTNAHLDGANLVGAILTDAKFINAKLNCAEPEDKTWERRLQFWKKDQQSCANLGAANLEGANLSGANLEGANLSGANMNQAKLEGSNLQRTTLCQTKIDSNEIDQKLKKENEGCDLGDYIVVNFGVPLPVFDRPEGGKRIASLDNGTIVTFLSESQIIDKHTVNTWVEIQFHKSNNPPKNNENNNNKGWINDSSIYTSFPGKIKVERRNNKTAYRLLKPL